MRIKIGRLYTRINTEFRFRTVEMTHNYVLLHGLENNVRFYVTKEPFEERYTYIR